MELSNKKSAQEIISEYPAIANIIQTEEEKAYLEGIGKQHFKPESEAKSSVIGSAVYEESCSSPFEALELIADKLGKDDSADRQKLIEKGAVESTFLPVFKYYIVEGVRGKSRIISVEKLAPNTLVKLVMSSKGLPSLIVNESDVPADALEDVNYATVILGPTSRNKTIEGQEVKEAGMTTWTMHAGYPVPMLTAQLVDENNPSSPMDKDEKGNCRLADRFGLKYGDVMTAAEWKKKFAEMAELTKDHSNPRVRVNPNIYPSIV